MSAKVYVIISLISEEQQSKTRALAQGAGRILVNPGFKEIVSNEINN